MTEPLTILSTIILFLQHKDVVKDKTIYGAISETLNEVEESSNLNRSVLLDFFSDKDTRELFLKSKKGQKIDLPELNEVFKKFCKKREIEIDTDFSFNKIVKTFEIQTSKKGVTEKINLQYLQSLESAVENLTDGQGKIFDKLQELTMAIKSKPQDAVTQSASKLIKFSKNGFQLDWPHSWEQISFHSEIPEKWTKIAKEKYGVDVNIGQPEIIIHSKMKYNGIHLAANVGITSVDPSMSVDQIILGTKVLFENEGIEIIDTYYDTLLDVGSVVSVSYVKGIKTILAQKFLKKDDRVFTLTINQIPEDLNVDLKIIQDIKEIAQSFRLE